MIDSPRIQLLVAEHGRTVAISLVVVGLLSLAVAGWVAANPDTTTVTQTVDEETVETDLHTSAEVTADDAPWERGTTLENSPVYLTDASPTVTLEPRTTVPDDSATVSHQLTLRLEATQDGEPFWEDERTLIDEEATVEDGEAVSTADLDVRELYSTVENTSETLSGVGSISASVHLSVQYDTGTYEGTLDTDAPFQLTSDSYWIDGSLADSETHATTVPIETTEPVDWTLVGFLAVLGFFAFGAAVGVVRAEDPDVEAIRQRLHQERYAEWISPGRLPMWVGQDYVELETLEDVVDVAIDTNQRVVHDRQRNLFAVISGEVVYYYSRHGNWEQVAWPEMNLGRDADDPDVLPTMPDEPSGPFASPADSADDEGPEATAGVDGASGAPDSDGNRTAGDEFDQWMTDRDWESETDTEEWPGDDDSGGSASSSVADENERDGV